jgi:signal transduction histidine kinase
MRTIGPVELAVTAAPAWRARRVSLSALVAIAIAIVAALANAINLLFLDFLGPIIVLPLSLATFAGVGLIVALRRPGHAVGWLFLVAGASWTLAFALPTYTWRALVEAPGTLPAGEIAAWLGRAIWVLAAASTMFSVILFPTGRPPSRIWVPVLIGIGALLAAMMTVFALIPEPTVLQRPWFADAEVPTRAIPNPIGVGGPFGEALRTLKPFLLTATSVPLMLVAIGAAIWRLARSSGVERVQLKWFAYAASFSFVLLITGFVLPKSVAGNLTWASGMAALGLIPVGAGIAILRHRLFDIDLLISRTVSYGLLSGIVVALYLVTVTSLGALLRRPEDPLVSAGAALVAALVFNPLRVRVQRAVDHLVYGRRDDPYAVIAELGRRLGAALDPESVLPTITRTVGGSLRLPYVAIELNAGDGERLVASHGTPRDRVIRLPLVYQQETVGHLLVSPRLGEVTLGRQDLAVLEALSRQAGVAAHGVHVTAELRRARERLVVAREEERRRLLRDLHDELGPRLASHTLLVDAARTALGRDAQRADALLADLAQETRRSLDEVRRIARGLRPPALDELGLSEALRDAAEQCASSRLAVEVDVKDIDSTPTAVETAAYHVAREALANVVRHAGARWCAVRLRRDAGGAVVLEVEDNGTGVAPGTSSGLGFKSMRERPAEVGGHCVIEARPGGGTRVTAVFPLGRNA